MRHDVDTQLDNSLTMAELENSLNISSTYFFRFHSHSYNPLCIKDARKIREISGLGHEVGLHYEPDFYSMIHGNFFVGLKNELNFLQQICGKKIVSIAPHEPCRTGIKCLDSDIKCELGVENDAYDSKFFDNFKYISDSSCRWREGSMLEHFTSMAHRKLYVLTHPYWWYDISPIENY